MAPIRRRSRISPRCSGSDSAKDMTAQTIPRAANSAAMATVESRTSDISAGCRRVLSTVSPDSSSTEPTRAIKAGSVVPRSSCPVPNGALPSGSTN